MSSLYNCFDCLNSSIIIEFIKISHQYIKIGELLNLVLHSSSNANFLNNTHSLKILCGIAKENVSRLTFFQKVRLCFLFGQIKDIY